MLELKSLKKGICLGGEAYLGTESTNSVEVLRPFILEIQGRESHHGMDF